MDCAKLKADIERLREARDAFDAAVTAINDTDDTSLGRIKCNEVMNRTSELEDEILQTYIEDARRHNPELFHHFHYCEKIDGIHGDITSTVKLSDSEVLVCGEISGHGLTRILRKSEDGLWGYDSSDIIGGFRGMILSALKLSDSEVLVCGGGIRRGETRILRKDEDGLWNYDSNSIDGFRNAACSTVKLSDNEVLVCGNDGETRILHTDIDIDLDKLKQKLPEIAAKKDEA